MDSASIVMPSTPGHTMAQAVTNGHASPLTINPTPARDLSADGDTDMSDTNENHAAAESSSDEDAAGDEYHEDEEMEIDSDASNDVDAEGEPDGDYDSDAAPAVQPAFSRARSSSSDDSTRPPKRKGEPLSDIEKNPELYGLRRSGRARPARRIVDDSDSNESASSSDVPRKRQRTISRKASNQPTPVYQANSDSESDGYVNARRNVPTKKQKQRRRLIAEGQLPPSQGEVRFSSRRTKNVTNYNEEEDDPFEEDDDEDMTPNYATEHVQSTGPAIDKILDHRPKDADNFNPKHADKRDFEYLVKYQDRAHYHAEWLSYDDAVAMPGFRKVDNYWRKIIYEIDLYIILRRKEDPEEYEQHMVQREAARESQLDHHVIERIIGTRSNDDGDTEYFVKWKGLTYDECTWEEETLVSTLAQTEIDRFLDRSNRLPWSDQKESNIKTRGRFVKIDEQPDYIKFGKLRSFQMHGLNFLAHNWCQGDNVILADEMGLGKTVQTVSFMNWLRHARRQDGPFLCVVPLSTMPAWADTFDKWTPDLNYVVYTGRESARNIIKEYELLQDSNVRKVKFNVLLTTYEFVLADWQFLGSIKWQFLAVDEAHRLKNRESQLYEKLMSFNAPSRLLITGTPIQNTLGELSALMDFLMPGRIMLDENVDLASEDASRKLAELSDTIKPFMIRRTKEKVENDLPPKSEKILRVELSDIQLELYKNILTRNYEALNQGSHGQKQSLLNIVMELKKASNHALMFPSHEARFLREGATKDEILKAIVTTSGKMMLLDRLMNKLKTDGHRVLIFSQMVHMLDILTDYLRLRNYPFQRLDGTVPARDRRVAIDHFNAPDSEDFCFLLSTRAGGLGINLMTADTVILFDSDWNPQADLQAMARAHRIGQQKPVTVYRLVSKDTIEEEILERARNKRMLEFITIQRGITDRQQKELNDKMKASEPNSADDINQILKRRGQKMFEQSGNQEKLEQLDLESLLANAEEHKTEQAAGITSDGGDDFLKQFEYTDVKIDLDWEDIIPKEDIDAAKAQMQQEETDRLVAEAAGRKRKAGPSDERQQRAAKKRAREATRHVEMDDDASGDDDNEREGGANKDPKRPLNEKELRNLIFAYQRYGSLEERGEEMLRDAKLTGRDMEVVKTSLDEIITMSQDLIKEEQAKLKALESENNRSLTKKDKKAVLFNHKGVKKINAQTVLERPIEMRILKQAVEAHSDWRNFRINDAIKPASYSCAWGAREDAMLCVGIARHGYGAWVPIRDDTELGMTDKFFLEEQRVDKKEERSKADEKNAKSPGAVHLVRRANYLLTVLKDKMGSDPNAKRLIENHHRNNKKNHMLSGRRSEKHAGSYSSSPAPVGQARKVHGRDTDRPLQRPHSNSASHARPESRQHHSPAHDNRARHGDQYRPSDGHRKDHHRIERGSIDRRSQNAATPELHRKPSGEADRRRASEERAHGQHSQSNTPSKGLEQDSDEFATRKLRPMQGSLTKLKRATARHFPEKGKLIKVLRTELIAVGNFIRAETRDNRDLEERLWKCTKTYWPKKDVTVVQLKEMYNKMLAAETKSRGPPHTNGTSQANGS